MFPHIQATRSDTPPMTCSTRSAMMSPTDRCLLQCHAEFLSEPLNHVLYANFVASDDHMVVLTASHSLPALGQHGEVLVDNRGVRRLVDLVVHGTHFII